MKINVQLFSENLRGFELSQNLTPEKFRVVEAVHLYCESNRIDWSSFNVEDVESVIDDAYEYSPIEYVDEMRSWSGEIVANEGNILHEYFQATELISRLSSLKPTNPERVKFI